MKPPEEVKRQLVQQWLAKAEEDIEAAATLLSGEKVLLHPSCFHSQQAAEKYLKAYLTWQQVEFPKTHSIREILKLVETVDEKLATTLLPAAALTPYGVDVRSPGDAPEPTQGEAEETLALARKVRNVVTSRLKEIQWAKRRP